MFRRLFAGLTGEPKRGQALFDLTVAEASRPDWFVAGEVPDTVNGRFAVLATVIALTMVRLEKEGEAGGRACVALTERLVESLDVEIREMGVGDPTLGKQVRGLIGTVGARVERWRSLVESGQPWPAEVRRSLHQEEPAAMPAVESSEAALRTLWKRLEDTKVEELAKGRLG